MSNQWESKKIFGNSHYQKWGSYPLHALLWAFGLHSLILIAMILDIPGFSFKKNEKIAIAEKNNSPTVLVDLDVDKREFEKNKEKLFSHSSRQSSGQVTKEEGIQVYGDAGPTLVVKLDNNSKSSSKAVERSLNSKKSKETDPIKKTESDIKIPKLEKSSDSVAQQESKAGSISQEVITENTKQVKFKTSNSGNELVVGAQYDPLAAFYTSFFRQVSDPFRLFASRAYFLKADSAEVMAKVEVDGTISFFREIKKSETQPSVNDIAEKMLVYAGKMEIPGEIFLMQETVYLPLKVEFKGNETGIWTISIAPSYSPVR